MRKTRWFAVGGSAAAAAALTLSLGGFASAGVVGTNHQQGAPAGVDLGARAATATLTTISHYTVAASAFGPDGSHTSASPWFNLWDPSTLSNTTPSRCFDAAVPLPNGVSIKSVTFYYTQGSSGMFAKLDRQKLSNHSFVDLATLSTTGVATGTPVYTKATVRVLFKTRVVNTGDGYSLGACFSGTTTFSGATVNYTG